MIRKIPITRTIITIHTLMGSGRPNRRNWLPTQYTDPTVYDVSIDSLLW